MRCFSPFALAAGVALVLAACAHELDDPSDGGADGGADPPASDAGAHGPDAGAPLDAGGGHEAPDAGPDEHGSDAGPPPEALPDPILFVHGINGSSADFDAMRARLVADGWPADRLFAHTFEDPSWGCNVDNAATVAAWIEDIRAQTGAARVDLVAHSMGTLSTRHYVKFLGGTDEVASYVTLGGQHHGLWEPCTAFLAPTDPENIPCVWDELCSTRDFIGALNEDPATPGDDVRWVSIYSTDDETVPATSSELDGAENHELSGIDHVGLLTEDAAYQVVRAALE